MMFSDHSGLPMPVSTILFSLVDMSTAFTMQATVIPKGCPALAQLAAEDALGSCWVFALESVDNDVKSRLGQGLLLKHREPEHLHARDWTFSNPTQNIGEAFEVNSRVIFILLLPIHRVVCLSLVLGQFHL